MSGKGVFVLHAVPLFVVTPVLHGDDTQTHARNTAIKKKKKKYWIERLRETVFYRHVDKGPKQRALRAGSGSNQYFFFLSIITIPRLITLFLR